MPLTGDILISVVIPVYNRARELPRALDSLRRQWDDRYELIVVDDGSTDHSRAVVESYTTGLPRLHYAAQANCGPAAARNHGVRISRGRYILFLDSDDQLLDGALSRFCFALQAHGEPDFCFGSHRRVRSDGTAKISFHKPLSRERHKNFRRYLRKDLPSIEISAGVVKRHVCSRLRFPEQIRNREDIVFLAQMLSLYDGIILPDLVAAKYRHKDSLSHDLRPAAADPLATVDLLFDPDVLPPGAMRVRREYSSLMCLSRCRAFCKQRDYGMARTMFHEAMRFYPRHWGRPRNLLRYLQISLLSPFSGH